MTEKIDLDGAEVNMDLAECFKWLYRHQAITDFSREGEDDVLTVAVPLRAPEQEIYKVFKTVSTQEQALNVFKQMVNYLSKRFYLE